MKDRIFAVLALTLVSAFNFQPATAFAQGTAFTYQGQLSSAGSPANGSYDLVFTLYTTNTTGSAIAGPVTNAATAVTNGLFTTLVNFGTGAFTGTSNWLAIAVSTNGANSFSILAPRQQVTPTPYALVAGSASGVNGLTIQQYGSGTPNLIVGADNSIAVGTLGATIDGGTNNSIATGSSWSGLVGGQDNSIGTGSSWSGLGGGYGNSIGANSYLSWLGGGYSNVISNNATVDVIGGGQNNIIQPYVNNAFIGGGGGNVIQGNANNNTFGVVSYSAIVGGSGNNIGLGVSYSFLGGGTGNTIQSSASQSALVGGGQNNILAGYSFLGGGNGNNILGSASEAALVGGQNNTINFAAILTFLGGGSGNTINAAGNYDVLAGGQGNIAGGSGSTVGGGYKNIATGNYATVPGGSNNIASGTDSFAAGSAAQATNPGAFVWADLETTPFTSTNANSFNVRANGGARFVTGGAGLTVDGQPVITGLPGAVVTNFETGVTLNNLNVGGTMFFSSITMSIYANNYQVLAVDNNNNSSFGVLAGGLGGNNNTALGFNALASNLTGNNNVATGNGALLNNDASYNTADGGYALQANTAGNKNVAVGYNALNANLTGNYNTASGFDALQNSLGNYNIADGSYALQNLQAGDNNIALGYNAGNNLTNGTDNIYIGNGAHLSESGVIRIGQAGNQTATYLAGTVTTTGSVGIGTNTPSATLEVNGNAQIDGTVAAKYLRAPGSGVNTHTYAFIQVAGGGNTSGDATEIDNPICDGDPNAILIVTHNGYADTAGVNLYNPGLPTVGVYYYAPNWVIQNDDLSTMPLGRAYNVMIIKP